MGAICSCEEVRRNGGVASCVFATPAFLCSIHVAIYFMSCFCCWGWWSCFPFHVKIIIYEHVPSKNPLSAFSGNGLTICHVWWMRRWWTIHPMGPLPHRLNAMCRLVAPCIMYVSPFQLPQLGEVMLLFMTKSCIKKKVPEGVEVWRMIIFCASVMKNPRPFKRFYLYLKKGFEKKCRLLPKVAGQVRIHCQY